MEKWGQNLTPTKRTGTIIPQRKLRQFWEDIDCWDL